MASRFKTRCPHCKSNIAYEAEHAGKPAKCPTCKGEVQIPKIPPVVPGLVASGSHSSRLSVPDSGAASEHQMLPSAEGGMGLAFSDPMDSQAAAMYGLGKEGTLTWGFTLCLVFPIVSWLAFWRGAATLITLIGREGEEGLQKAKFLDHLEVVVSMSVLVVILLGVLFVLNAMHGKKVPLREVLFTTGLILLPLVGLALYGLGLSFFKIKSADAMEVIGYVTTFSTLLSLSSFFLLVFAAITSVIGYSKKAGFWLTPAVLIVVIVLFGWISKLTSEIGKMGN